MKRSPEQIIHRCFDIDYQYMKYFYRQPRGGEVELPRYDLEVVDH